MWKSVCKYGEDKMDGNVLAFKHALLMVLECRY